MPTVTISYEDALRTTLTHQRSGKVVVTDAPPDNHGKGEAFSPTDLLAASLLSCMVTVMGISAEAKKIHLGRVEGAVTKTMAESPRRVSELEVLLDFHHAGLTQKEKAILENAAMNCPVAKSLHPEIIVRVKFNYPG